MGSSYQSSNFNSQANISSVTNIMTQNQNVAIVTSITTQDLYITIGTANCPGGISFTNDAQITVTVTGQMNTQTANDISTYMDTSLSASLDQNTKVVTELLGIYGSNVQKSDIKQAISQFCQQNITSSNLQSVMANVRASQTQHITIGTLNAGLCTFTNNIVVAIAANAVLTSIANTMATSSLTSKMAATVAQYYDAEAKGLNSLVSAALTALLIPAIIAVVAIVLIIILVVVFKLIASKNHSAVTTQARQLGLNPNAPTADADSAAIAKKIDVEQTKLNLAAANQPTVAPLTRVAPTTARVAPTTARPTVAPRPSPAVTRPRASAVTARSPPPLPPKPILKTAVAK